MELETPFSWEGCVRPGGAPLADPAGGFPEVPATPGRTLHPLVGVTLWPQGGGSPCRLGRVHPPPCLNLAPLAAWEGLWPGAACCARWWGRGPTAVTHFWTACSCFSPAAPQSCCLGPRCGARPPGTTPQLMGPREIPGALRHPAGVLAESLAGVAVSHLVSPGAPPARLEGPSALRSLAAPRTLGTPASPQPSRVAM